MPSSQSFLRKIDLNKLRFSNCGEKLKKERVGTVSKMSYGGWSGTETLREQGYDLGDYPGGHTRRSN